MANKSQQIYKDFEIIYSVNNGRDHIWYCKMILRIKLTFDYT